MVEVFYHLLQIRYQLNSTCAISYYCHRLSNGVEIRIPCGSVSQMPFVIVDSRIIRQSPGVETPDSIYHHVESLFRSLSRLQAFILNRPLTLLVIPSGTDDSPVQLQILVDIVFLCESLPVISYLSSLCIFFRPLCPRIESRLVDIGGYVAANSGVYVFEPRSAHIRVLVVYCQLDARYLDREQNSSCNSGEASTNDSHLQQVKSGSLAKETSRLTRIRGLTSIGWSSRLETARFGCEGLADEDGLFFTLLSGTGATSTVIGAFSFRTGSTSRVGTLETSAGADMIAKSNSDLKRIRKQNSVIENNNIMQLLNPTCQPHMGKSTFSHS